MRYWDAGKPAAPRKEGKQAVPVVSSHAEKEPCTPERGKADSSSGEQPCGKGAMHPGMRGKQVVPVVSCPAEEEPCTLERRESRMFQW